jgi:hypothetical protein
MPKAKPGIEEYDQINERGKERYTVVLLRVPCLGVRLERVLQPVVLADATFEAQKKEKSDRMNGLSC